MYKVFTTSKTVFVYLVLLTKILFYILLWVHWILFKGKVQFEIIF